MRKQKLSILNVLFNFKKNVDGSPHYSNARKIIEFKIELKRLLGDIFMVSIGILSAGFGLKSFLLPNGFLDGGATGISLLISNISGINLAILLVLVNLPFVVIGYYAIGKSFAIKTAMAITGLALCVAVIHFPEITHDKLLVAVFGGFFLGAGIGMAVRGGAVIDGTEVLAIALSKKLSLTIGDVIMLVNIIIFSVSAALLSMETALYAMLTYLSASKTVDFILEGIEEYTGVTIISVKADKIRNMITRKLGRHHSVQR
jgi:uncharacterized membrane-anchored protein YitT (DUF2179 family)